jgi:hypothetical protein
MAKKKGMDTIFDLPGTGKVRFGDITTAMLMKAATELQRRADEGTDKWLRENLGATADYMDKLAPGETVDEYEAKTQGLPGRVVGNDRQEA